MCLLVETKVFLKETQVKAIRDIFLPKSGNCSIIARNGQHVREIDLMIQNKALQEPVDCRAR